MMTPVRRFGCRPSGRTPACAATSSPQAPGGVHHDRGAEHARRRWSPPPIARRGARSRPERLRRLSTPPWARSWRRKPWWSAATSMSNASSSIAAGHRVVGLQRRRERAELLGRAGAQPDPLRQHALEMPRAAPPARGTAPGRRCSSGVSVKPCRRVLEEGARQAGEHAHVGRTVIQDPDRGRAAGAVIARDLLGLDQRHACDRRASAAAAVAPAMPAPITTASKRFRLRHGLGRSPARARTRRRGGTARVAVGAAGGATLVGDAARRARPPASRPGAASPSSRRSWG